MNYFSKCKIILANSLPITSIVSRFIKAVYYKFTREKASYSQHGEDVFIWNLLNKNLPGIPYNYVDVGGFHPTLLSNTYLMYRRKMSGAVIEPNRELVNLHKTFRPRDIQLEVACSNVNMVSKFYLQKTFPALSSFNNVNTNRKIKCQFVPVLDLDTIVTSLGYKQVHFLSIDVEGFDYEVLLGAEKTLTKTFIVCIECDTKELEDRITQYLEKRGFTLLCNFSCNLIFKNEHFIKARPSI